MVLLVVLCIGPDKSHTAVSASLCWNRRPVMWRWITWLGWHVLFGMHAGCMWLGSQVMSQVVLF